MGETPSVLSTMFTNITDVITHLANQLFQIVLGIVFFSIAMGVVFGLVRKVRNHGK